MMAPRQRATESVAKSKRDRERFQGFVTASRSCAACGEWFEYKRHIGRIRKFCSPWCAYVANLDRCRECARMARAA